LVYKSANIRTAENTEILQFPICTIHSRGKFYIFANLAYYFVISEAYFSDLPDSIEGFK